MLKNFIRTGSIALTLCWMAGGTVVAQDETEQPGLQINPSTVVQKPDAKSLMDKASYLIGYNFMNSLKQQGDVDMKQVLEGMEAASKGEDRTGFVAGYQMMKSIKSQGVDLVSEQCRQGMEKALANEDLGMSDEEVQLLMTSFSKMMEDKRVAKLKVESEANLAAGKAYIDKRKAENPNLKELENGMYYEVIEPGEGENPTTEDQVKVDYVGTFINGKVFDSSLDPPSGRPAEPAVFPVAGVVPGFSKALQSMKPGAKWRVIIPGPMAYGVRGSGEIGPNETLIFEIKLLEIIK